MRTHRGGWLAFLLLLLMTFGPRAGAIITAEMSWRDGHWREEASSGTISNSVSYTYEPPDLEPRDVTIHAAATLDGNVGVDLTGGFLDTRAVVFSGINDPFLGSAIVTGDFGGGFSLSEPHEFHLVIEYARYAARPGRGDVFYSFQGPSADMLLDPVSWTGLIVFDLYEGAGSGRLNFSGVLEPGEYSFSVRHRVFDTNFDHEWTFATTRFALGLQPLPDAGSTILFLGWSIGLLAMGLRRRSR